MPSVIPIRNVYFLLCYAWNRLSETGLADVASDGVTELVDLLARVMVNGVSRLRRSGFERGYKLTEAEIPGIRGRIKIWDTVGRFQDRHGRATCIYDDLTIDTPQNRVIKAAMRALCSISSLGFENRSKLKRLVNELFEVTDLPLERGLFREVRLHANNRHYKFLIDVSRLILDCAIPDEVTGNYRFRDFSREGPEMARLFEAFVRNFLRVERPDLDVGAEDVEWIATSDEDPELSLLPNMRTDINVRSLDRTLVIDTKFYHDTLQTNYSKQTIHSGHLYQLVGYLRNMESRPNADASAEGMLLYPVTSNPIDVGYVIQGHKIRVRTIDLAMEWHDIEAQMLKLF